MSAFYDSYDYVTYWQGRKYEDEAEKLALEKLLKKVNKREFLVDIGGGFGRLSPFYSLLFKKCLVIDPSEKHIQIGSKRNKNFVNVSFKVGSLPNLPLEENSVDLALVIRVSHHLLKLSPSIKEVRRILRKDGFLILEVANKIHFLARIKAFFGGDFNFCRDLSPLERRSRENIQTQSITFLNHNPKKIIKELAKENFAIIKILSVSNLRSPFLKKILPQGFLVFLEKYLQSLFSACFFGPSIFILAKKVD